MTRLLGTLLAILMTVTTSVSQDCLYQYVQQPPSTISCNPYTSKLQLHCIFIGPLSPLLQIKWYSFHRDTPGALNALSQSSDFYTIENIVMDVAMGMRLRSISSILKTGTVTEQQTGLCYLCKAQIGDVPLPVASNSLCIQDPSYYNDMPLCKDSNSPIVNTTTQCVSVPLSFMEQLQRLATETPSQASSESLNPTRSSNGQSFSNIGTVSPTIYINTATSSKESLHTSSPVAKTTAHTMVTPTPLSTLSTVAQTTTVTIDTDDKMTSSTIEAGLYAAIVVCAIFVIVIGALVIVIVCLSRRKCKCLGWRFNTRKRKDGQADRGGVGNRVFMTGSTEAQALMRESGPSGSGHSNDVIDGPRLIGPPVNDHMTTTQQILNKRSPLRDSYEGTTPANNDCDQRPPNLPPKPGKLPPTQKGLSTNYDHLELVDEGKRRSGEQVQNDVPKAGEPNLDVPPKKPPRSRSRDHFYHTLESSDETGLLRSANTSAQSSRISSRLSHREDEVENDFHTRQNRSSMLSEQLQEMFDDPRYAMLFVDEGEERGQLDGRRELCRSTPSLVLISKPGVPERRSLRTSHKRISILHEPLNNHSHC